MERTESTCGQIYIVRSAALAKLKSFIFDLIKEKEASGWAFIYLGANQDAWEVAGSIGIGKQYSASYDASNPDGTLRTVAASTLRGKSAMRRGRKPGRAFTRDEMQRMMERKMGTR